MAKLTMQDKIDAVKRYLEGVDGVKTICKTFGITSGVMQNLIKQFQHHGEEAFQKRYTTYSADYKLKILNYINEHGTSIREAAAIFNIPAPTTILKWKHELETKGFDALIPKNKGRPPMKEKKKPIPTEGSVEALQAEIERLRMENAYLKKLNALVQSKETLRNKTKRK